MDHLLLPPNAVKLEVEIPYLCQFQYDGPSFREFPLRHGFGYDAAGWLEAREGQTQIEILAFYQTWLYFGLMTAIFAQPIDPKVFVRSGTTIGTQVISSKKLPDLMDGWRLRYKRKLLSVYQDRLRDDAEGHLALAIKHCCQLDQLPSSHFPRPWPEVLLSIKVLLTSLATVIKWPKLIPRALLPLTGGQFSDPLSTKLLIKHMESTGWCPIRTRSILIRTPYHVAYYLACLAQNTSREADHTECEETGLCKGDSIEGFEIKHRENCNKQCSTEEPSADRVASIISKGGIPLVSIVHETIDEYRVEIIEATRSIDYTAITHVWADGLGKISEQSKYGIVITLT